MAEAEYYNWKGMVHAKFNIAWKMRRYQNEITQWFNILNFFHIAPTPNTAAHLPPPTDQSTNLDLPTGPGTSFHPKSTSANPYTDQLWPHPHVYLHCGLHLQLPSLLQKAKLQQVYQQTIAECSGTSLQLFHCMLPRLHLFGESQDLPSDPLRPYVCSVCSKPFHHSGALTRHFRIHMGEKPYICADCEKTVRKCGGPKFHKHSHNKYLQQNVKQHS